MFMIQRSHSNESKTLYDHVGSGTGKNKSSGLKGEPGQKCLALFSNEKQKKVLKRIMRAQPNITYAFTSFQYAGCEQLKCSENTL